ncbi:hypothetical protein [Bacteroides sp.]|uniref:hypothetical protein n=1 Tax=Bacteroides sp. TaxID=29523 RepID=UPI0026284EA8|nr:hypothetical protein [Bacteroides sp.]MDD3036388.1 hypothetical protein [Bacteroides sp.]
MRTFYILTQDFEHFTEPERLFNFPKEADREMATIDAIIRKIDGTYYAIIKDERWSEHGVPTGKSVRISHPTNPTGPYNIPEQSVTTPYTYFEAPIPIPKPNNNGWMIFSEKYPHEYVRFQGGGIDAGQWECTNLTIPDSRHEAMIRISEKEYKLIISTSKH